jgi:hypothetical protein
MRLYNGTQTVDPGLYFDSRRLSFRSMDETGSLPGTIEDVYRRVPTLALLFVGPLLGLVYVLFLPFIGLAMVGWLLAKKTAAAASDARHAASRALAPAWRTATAFLSRSKRARKRAGRRDGWAEKTKKRLEDSDSDD